MSKSIEINLEYFKQGDDLAGCLEETGNNVEEALRLHAEMLQKDVDHLIKLADTLKNQDVTVEADSHSIMLECDEDLADQLVAADLADEPGFQDDLDDDDFEEDTNEEDELFEDR